MLEKLPDAVGHALADVRAGLDHVLFNALPLRQGQGAITVGSLAFADHAPIPQRYTADGPGISPPLHWSGIPDTAHSVVVLVEDADSPTPQPLVHAIVHALPADDAGALAEGVLGGGDAEPAVSMGRNSLLQSRWLPPDPPPGHGAHRYVFQVYALNAGATLDEHPGRDALRSALQQHAIASGWIIGTYERPDGSITERRQPETQAPAADVPLPPGLVA